LTVYDLEGLDRAPEMLVLSACESGSFEVRPGNEIMGLVAGLLALGTRTVVASVFPVPDEATKPLMLSLHRGLRAGLGPAAALARAQAGSTRSGPTGIAAAAAFVCFGAGR
jgi:CHAT domain-containing protein